jgi:HNH endonuclease
MLIQNVFESYLQSSFVKNNSSLGVYKGKIDKYIKFIGNLNIEKALQEENLRNFIFNQDQLPQGKYDALYNFYRYYHEKILNIPKREVTSFPVDPKEVKNTKKENEKRETVYFPKGFDFNMLFDDRFYHHLKSPNAMLAIKCSLSLALSAGYDSGEMFPTNRKNISVMTLADCLIDNEYVKVRNFYSQSTVPWILIRGKNAQYIKEYYEIRKSYKVKHSGQEENFIAHVWDTRNELNIDPKVSSQKPYTPHELVSYMLKYITNQLGISTPYITDLRANSVLHALYNSKGSALQDIIELFGYPPFVKQAFEQYCMEIDRGLDTYYSPLSLDILAEAKEINGDLGDNEKKKFKSREHIIDKLVRDRPIVKRLKNSYANRCQICDEQITFLNDISYSEVHHIQPYNKIHNGIDDIPNMLVLCPNHHKIFDLGIIALDPEDHLTILHVDKKNPINHQQLNLSHTLSSICVRYHFENIFLPLKTKLQLL